MKYKIDKKLFKQLTDISEKNQKLTKKIKKQLDLFLDNEKHPSLRNHQLKGNLKRIWSISIDMDIRMLYEIKEDHAYFFDIGTHDEIYNE